MSQQFRSKWARVMLNRGKTSSKPSSQGCSSTSNENLEPDKEIACKQQAQENEEQETVNKADTMAVMQLSENLLTKSQIINNKLYTGNDLHDVMCGTVVEDEESHYDLKETSCMTNYTPQLSLSDVTPDSTITEDSTTSAGQEDETKLQSAEMDVSIVNVTLECTDESYSLTDKETDTLSTEFEDDMMQLDFDCSEASANIYQSEIAQLTEKPEVPINIMLLSTFDIHVTETPEINNIMDNIKQAHIEACNKLMSCSKYTDLTDINILELLENADNPELNYIYLKLKQVCDNAFNALLVRLIEDYLKNIYLLEQPNDMDQNWMNETKEKISNFLKYMNKNYHYYSLESNDINKKEYKTQITVSNKNCQTENDYIFARKTVLKEMQTHINMVNLISGSINDQFELVFDSKFNEVPKMKNFDLVKRETNLKFLKDTKGKGFDRNELLNLRYSPESIKHPNVSLKPEIMAANNKSASEQGDNYITMPISTIYKSAFKATNNKYHT